MLCAAAIVAVAAATSAGAPPALSLALPSLSLRAPDANGSPLAASAGPEPEPAGPPPCVGDVCQPQVSVPGFEPRYARPSRTELAAVYLERFRIEPLATIAWALVATGLRLDYTPPVLEGPSAAPTRWGSVFVRVKFRIGPDNLPRIPSRRPSSRG